MNKEAIIGMYQAGTPIKVIAERVRQYDNTTIKKAETKVVGIICAHKLAERKWGDIKN